MPRLSDVRPPSGGSLEVQKWVARFQEACQQAAEDSPTIELNSFLPGVGDPLRLPVLHQLIRLDLEYRWAAGRHVTLEYYLPRFTELGSLRSLPADLVLHEYRVRSLHGDLPDLELYRARFPEQYPHVLQQIQDQLSDLPGSLPSASCVPPLPNMGGGMTQLSEIHLLSASTFPALAAPAQPEVQPPDDAFEQIAFDDFPPTDNAPEVSARSVQPAEPDSAPVVDEDADGTVSTAFVTPPTPSQLAQLPAIADPNATVGPPSGAASTQQRVPPGTGIGAVNSTHGPAPYTPATHPRPQNPTGTATGPMDLSGGLLVPATSPSSTIIPIGGGYRLVTKLGSGMFGEVWKAEALQGGTEVAIKIVKCSVDKDEAQQELKALEYVKRLRHPCLLQTQVFGIWNDHLCIVMDLADRSLLDRAQECRKSGQPGIPVDELIRYISQAAEGLDYLHAEQVHHRDIKPANILLLKGYARLADFGLARTLQVQGTMIDATAMGTPAFMPPEVWQGKVSPHSDQWSLAATYADLRLNRRLFKSRNYVSLMTEICAGPPDLTGFPEAEKQVLRKAMAQSPKERYPTCAAFARALWHAYHPSPSTSSSTQKALLTSGPRAWLLAAGMACLIMLVAAAAYTIISPSVSSQNATQLTSLAPSPRIEVTLPPPLFVDTERESEFTLKVTRTDFAGKVRISFAEQDLGSCKIEPRTLDEDQDEIKMKIVAGTAAKDYKATLTAEALDDDGGVLTKGNAVLHFAVVFLPKGFERASNVRVQDGKGVYYYKEIAFIGGALPIRFVLIPNKDKGEPGTNQPTFYIMKHKVTLGQFREFASVEENKAKLINPERKWDKRPDADPEQPVFYVALREAHAFAKWINEKANVPTVDQWDMASGAFEKPRIGDGPFEGKWNKEKRKDIAVNRKEPMRVREETGDVSSPYGCYNMAGNGDEWTRSYRNKDEYAFGPDSPPRSDGILCRGRSFSIFKRDHPLLYSEYNRYTSIYSPDPTRPNEPDTAHNDLGFRVVIEP